METVEAECVRLFVNAEGLVEVELLDADTGQAITGFARGDCLPIENGLDTPVAWKGGETLGQVRERRIAVRFHLVGNQTRLYSFRFGRGS